MVSEGTRTIGVAQLGCGYWGPNLLRNLIQEPRADVRWVAEPAEARRAYVGRTYPGTPLTADWKEALADASVQAVVIATPASTHFDLARAALEAGKHVLVEKPLATSVGEVETLQAAAESRGRVLMVGHTFLFSPAVRMARALLDKGELGDLYYMYSQRLNLGQVRADVNVWWNLAPHDVSIFLHLAKGALPAEVAVRGVDYLQPGVEDVVFATLRWPDRLMANLHASWLDPGRVRRLTLVGSRKMLVYDDVEDSKIALVDKGVDRVPRLGDRMDYDRPPVHRLQQRMGDILLPKVDNAEPLAQEIAHFLDCIESGARPLTDARHARDVVAVLEAGARSLKRGGEFVTVPH